MPLQPRLPNDIGCFTVYMGWQWRFLHTPPCWRYTILVTSVLRHKRTYARKLLRELYTVRNARSANNCSVSVCINCTCKMAACHDNDANDVTTPHVDMHHFGSGKWRTPFVAETISRNTRLWPTARRRWRRIARRSRGLVGDQGSSRGPHPETFPNIYPFPRTGLHSVLTSYVSVHFISHTNIRERQRDNANLKSTRRCNNIVSHEFFWIRRTCDYI